MSKGWRRLVVISCTLLLVGGMFMVLGMTVWAQEPPAEQPTEQPVEQPAGTEQPAQTTQTDQATQGPGLTIDYWEPQVGTRTVYYINDYLDDIHGNKFGTSALGYGDIDYLWDYRADIVIFRVPDSVDYRSSYYYNVEALSDMNPVYFDLEGPWYFNMTTPYKVVKEIKGIHEVPDAASFPEATYAQTVLNICSGGHRTYFVEYKSNDADAKQWKTWGYTVEYIPEDGITPIKETVHFYSPIDPNMKAPVIESFPKTVGDTGSIDAVAEVGLTESLSLASGTYKVIAEGKITVPGGTFDALLIEKNMMSSISGKPVSNIAYEWFAKDLGVVVQTRSLPDILGPEYGETTGYQKSAGMYFYQTKGLLVLEEQTSGTATPPPQQQ